MAKNVIVLASILATSLSFLGCSSDEQRESTTTIESGSHAWGTYHWERTADEVALPLGDNLAGGDWDALLAQVSSDWSQSSVIQTSIDVGLGGKSCKANVGRIEVCNRKYGFNGWIGLAQIWISRGHIFAGVAKMNESYFALSRYNNANARRHVLCQEVGHGFGLDHQDGQSCMNDHAGLSDASYVGPNAHDYAQLETMYAHDHASAAATTSSLSSDDADFGAEIERGPAESTFAKDLGGGVRRLTFVRWAER